MEVYIYVWLICTFCTAAKQEFIASSYKNELCLADLKQSTRHALASDISVITDYCWFFYAAEGQIKHLNLESKISISFLNFQMNSFLFCY